MTKSLGLLLVAFFMTSCATILNDDTQTINLVTSNNVKTKVTIDGMPYEAPGIIQVKRQDKDLIVQAQNKKCVQQMVVKHEVDNKFWINILSGGTFGSSTDYSTEKMWTYDNTITINCN